jgi:hypothetical protein
VNVQNVDTRQYEVWNFYVVNTPPRFPHRGVGPAPAPDLDDLTLGGVPPFTMRKEGLRCE